MPSDDITVRLTVRSRSAAKEGDRLVQAEVFLPRQAVPPEEDSPDEYTVDLEVRDGESIPLDTSRADGGVPDVVCYGNDHGRAIVAMGDETQDDPCPDRAE